MAFSTPILFLIFNRPDTTRKVFKRLRQVEPKYLYIAADGPRKSKEGELQQCKEARRIVDEGIDWNCKVTKLYREENLGCGLAVSSAIKWFFEHVEEGIILEDDTEPDTSFFRYCENLLAYYRYHDQVMHISGSNFAPGANGKYTYSFTRLPFIWGWATWRRAWQKYDYEYKHIAPEQKKGILEKVFSDKEMIAFWCDSILKDFHLKPLSYTWDYQWFLSIWDNNGFVIQPKKNLVRNIGYGKAATHTTDEYDYLSTVQAKRIYNITHQQTISINELLQQRNFEVYFMRKHNESYIQMLQRRLKLRSVKALLKRLNPNFN